MPTGVSTKVVAQRSSFRKGVLTDFCEIPRKTFVRESLFNKVVYRPATCNFTKKETLAQMFSCELYGILKSTHFAEQLRTPAFEASFMFRMC